MYSFQQLKSFIKVKDFSLSQVNFFKLDNLLKFIKNLIIIMNCDKILFLFIITKDLF